ncbi:hypothetical protein [Ferruginibacter sp.]|nr:hypothetical protein [Ferruginibacter sp.]
MRKKVGTIVDAKGMYNDVLGTIFIKLKVTSKNDSLQRSITAIV